MMRRSTFIFSILALLARHVRAGCYFPDGTIDNNVEYQPCSQDESNPLSTICCATNRKDGADICSPNGLCQVGTKKGSPPADAAWTKPSCTKKDWSEEGCLHVCGTDKYPFLTPCNRAAGNESQRWCCGMSQDCCNEDSDLSIEYLPITFDPSITNFTDPAVLSSSSVLSKPTSSAAKAPSSSTEATASTSASPSTTASALTSAAEKSTETPALQTSPGFSTGAKAGVGVGVSCGALFLVGLGIFYGRRRYAQRNSLIPELPSEKNATVYAHWDQSQGGTSYGGSSHGGERSPLNDETTQIHEMPVFESKKDWEDNERLRSGNIELDSVRPPKELFA